MMMMMFLLLYRRETEARRGDGEDGRLSEEAERHESSGADGHSLRKEVYRRMGGESGLFCWKFATVSWSFITLMITISARDY
jgi:hypothetical protein